MNKKDEHISLCMRKNVSSGASNGFEQYNLPYNALPELDMDKIDLRTHFIKDLNSPFMISAMTGGTAKGQIINQNLAQAAQDLGIAMCVGSQRIALKNPALMKTFSVRDIAPDILLFANIGAVQLNYGISPKDCENLVSKIDADGLVLHLNPLQEAIQPEGNRNFENLAARIKELTHYLSCPVIVKEVGHGISGRVASQLEKMGIFAVDVAGLGGTSFARVESYRRKGLSALSDLGIPTADCITGVKQKTKLKVIASGGIRSGVDAAKAIALGSDMVGIASPLLVSASKSAGHVKRRLRSYIEELRIAMFTAGVKKIDKLKSLSMTRAKNAVIQSD